MSARKLSPDSFEGASQGFYGVDRPSRLLQAMIAGIREAYEHPDFLLFMLSYGGAETAYVDGETKHICIGCAATCALQHLADYWFVPEDYDGYHQQDGSVGYWHYEILRRRGRLSMKVGRETSQHLVRGFEFLVDSVRVGGDPEEDTYVFIKSFMNWQRHLLQTHAKWGTAWKQSFDERADKLHIAFGGSPELNKAFNRRPRLEGTYRRDDEQRKLEMETALEVYERLQQLFEQAEEGIFP